VQLEASIHQHTYSTGTPLEHTALVHVRLSIAPGERVGILGPMGSGKSTLVQILAGLLEPTSGWVTLDGIPVYGRGRAARSARRSVGLVFQYPEDQIFSRTVLDEVSFGPRNLGLGQEAVLARVRRALETVGVDPDRMGMRSPLALSGGEMRRVALASILSMQPRVLILDEPTAGLDPRGRQELIARVLQWQQEQKQTLVLVSHSLEDLARSVDRILLLHRGSIAADDTARHVLGNSQLLQSVGLECPAPVALLELLQQRGWPVRTDRITAREAAVEIERAAGAREAAQ
jgi:energy-coupling factor transport system ATP-binding protein